MMTRPFITLSYAQSLDGSITATAGQPLALSGPEAMKLTHELRAGHDAILVGIGTVLADNPRLTVRLASGPNPQPVVLDSRLRLPFTANLLGHPKPPIIASTDRASAERQAALESKGARVIRFPANEGGRVHLPALLEWLAQNGIKSVMVEGGSAVITSFLSAHLVDRVIVTIAPRFVGGLHAVTARCDLPLRNARYRVLGADVIVEADTTAASLRQAQGKL